MSERLKKLESCAIGLRGVAYSKRKKGRARMSDAESSSPDAGGLAPVGNNGNESYDSILARVKRDEEARAAGFRKKMEDSFAQDLDRITDPGILAGVIYNELRQVGYSDEAITAWRRERDAARRPPTTAARLSRWWASLKR